MSFKMSGYFESYSGWETTVIKLCLKFFRKYRCYPTYITVSESTMDELFDEVDREFEEPYSDEHGALSSNGKKLITVQMDDNGNMIFPEEIEKEYEEDDSWMVYGDFDGRIGAENTEEKENTEDTEDSDMEEIVENDEIEEIEEDSEEDEDSELEEDDDDCYPMHFGPNDDNTVSFVTNRFSLDFLSGEGFSEKYFELQYGDGPDGDDGEDFDEDEVEEEPVQKRTVA